MSRTVLVGLVTIGLLAACGGRATPEPCIAAEPEPDAAVAPSCGDGVVNGDEDCDDTTAACVGCRYVGPESNDCSIVGSCGDGRTRYRCMGPDGGIPITIGGRAAHGCTSDGVDQAGGQLFCCEPTCVRNESGDASCIRPQGSSVLCPAGDDDRSAIGPPASGCEFGGRVGSAAGYCCE
jgi:hypothetical protein